MSEAELLRAWIATWPSLRRWIEVPGVTAIHLTGEIAESLPFLDTMARLAVQRQGCATRVEFSFIVYAGERPAETGVSV